MKKILTLLSASCFLVGCGPKEEVKEEFKSNDYGAFLGRSENNVLGFNNYKYVSVELFEFTSTNIKRLSENGTYFLAYLNIGSLENYRDYYDEYESWTFRDYENWPEERWIDVTNSSWQDLMVSLATDFKNEGAFGVYLDNVDVYSVAKEDELNYQDYASAIKSIITRINALGLKVMINGGTEFLDDMSDSNDSIFDSIWAYHQEEVFTLVDDYEENIFTVQQEEDKTYYQQIAELMKVKGKEVFLLEYTTDNTLIGTIKNYCEEKQYHYYIANNVELL